ncbi:PKD domain-containing protein [uncultured Shewanella sp.]|uniref:PKD domain-containing protein n=1 Tax=uncultured Shewanella sp. TaxID=173975 RepID=UPI002603F4B7|nr:PKD domain-containing protein [uncultured Shewanella sp.]
MKSLLFFLSVLPITSFFLAISFAASTNEVQINLHTSNTVGVAPFNVHFDASQVALNQVQLDPFSEVHYHWQFNDNNQAYWSTNNHAKNLDEGFITAHLFESPGQYQVDLTVSSPTGAFTPVIKTILIQVQDPNDIYPGNNTICLSMNNQFEACPFGAQQVQLNASSLTEILLNNPFQANQQKQLRVWNPYKEYVLNMPHSDTFEYIDYQQQWSCLSALEEHEEQLLTTEQINAFFTPNIRLLFHRGERFIFTGPLMLGEAHGSSIGAYGTCEKENNNQTLCDNAPQLDFIGAASYQGLLVFPDSTHNINVSDLSLTHLCGDRNRAISLKGSNNAMTFNRLQIQKFDTAIAGSTYGQQQPHDLIGIFNSHFKQMGAAKSTNDYSNQCHIPITPNWHTGDKLTPVSFELWQTQWQTYKVALYQLAINNQCKSGGNLAYLPAHRHMIMGNEMEDAITQKAEHVLRIPLAYKSVISHNSLKTPSNNKHALKLHNQGDCAIISDCNINPVQSADNYPTAWVLLRHNIFKANTDIIVNIGPGTSKQGEQIHHILFENNTLEATGSQNQFAMMLSAHHSTIRFNHMQQHPLSDYWTAISIAKGKNEPQTANNNVIKGNTTNGYGHIDFVRLYEGTNDTQITDNIICSEQEPTFIDAQSDDIVYQHSNNLWLCQ